MYISAINVSKDTAAQSSFPSVSSDIANKNNSFSTEGTFDQKLVDQKSVNRKKLKQMTDAMNQFAEAIDVNIHFKIHEGTKELMVQVVDQTNNRVLKEFPPHEFLDTVAAIRSYVGILLDKKI